MGEARHSLGRRRWTAPDEPSSGPNPWNMTAPDGFIDLPNDVLGVILQFGHDCR